VDVKKDMIIPNARVFLNSGLIIKRPAKNFLPFFILKPFDIFKLNGTVITVSHPG
jgi:hypothetical protein